MEPQLRLVHVSFSFRGANPSIDEIEKAFARAHDWLRYDHRGWILYTNSSLTLWRQRLLRVPSIKDNATFLLTEMDLNGYAGYLDQAIWDWIESKREGPGERAKKSS
jgi:hypothetical protein